MHQRLGALVWCNSLRSSHPTFRVIRGVDDKQEPGRDDAMRRDEAGTVPLVQHGFSRFFMMTGSRSADQQDMDSALY